MGILLHSGKIQKIVSYDVNTVFRRTGSEEGERNQSRPAGALRD